MAERYPLERNTYERKHCEIEILITKRNQPYRVQFIVQWPLLRITDEILNNLQLFHPACFKSAGVVENISFITREDEFVLDVVLATLYKNDPHDQLSLT
jgi:hypothetical protein